MLYNSDSQPEHGRPEKIKWFHSIYIYICIYHCVRILRMQAARQGEAHIILGKEHRIKVIKPEKRGETIPSPPIVFQRLKLLCK